MSWLDTLNQIFQVCIIPLLAALAGLLVSFISKKSRELQERSKSQFLDDCIKRTELIINNCVKTTTQTYVDNIKKEHAFDADAQKKAFDMTYQAVLKQLNDDAKKLLTDTFGDLNTYLTIAIESAVKTNK